MATKALGKVQVYAFHKSLINPIVRQTPLEVHLNELG